jgi:hypothetical protein
VLCGGGSSAVTPLGSLRKEGTTIMGVGVDKVYPPAPLVAAIAEESAAEQVAFLDGSDIDHAVFEARRSDVVILFAQEWRSEGLDAIGLGLPGNQDALIHAVAAANPSTTTSKARTLAIDGSAANVSSLCFRLALDCRTPFMSCLIWTWSTATRSRPPFRSRTSAGGRVR